MIKFDNYSDILLKNVADLNSKIAQQIQLGRDKVGYVINHGLNSYFKEELMDKLDSASFYSVLFDESLNKIAQRDRWIYVSASSTVILSPVVI